MDFSGKRRHCTASVLALTCLGFSAGVGSQPAAPAKAAVILVVGDSLSAEYGLQRGTGWVALLEKKIAAEKINAKVINASISGDTTSGGRSRLAALLKQHRPTHVIVELGGNDALRGLPLKMTEDNLMAMTDASLALQSKVLILGMQLPPNYGTTYGKAFADMFGKVAAAKKVALVPFFLKNVADTPDPLTYFQSDRIHPNASAQPRMLANVWPELRKLLK